MNDTGTLSENIGALMLHRELTGAALAEKCHLPAPTVNRIKNGKHKSPRPDSVRAIAGVFGLTFDQIYDRDFVTKLISGDENAVERAARRLDLTKRLANLDRDKQEYILDQIEAALRFAEKS